MLSNTRDTPNVSNMIRIMHAECPGGTWCDCQHVTGTVLNHDRIEGKNAVSE